MSSPSPAAQAWTLLFELLMAQRGRVPAIAAEFQLSPVQCQVLRLLDPDAPMPMGRLASCLACDASNVTGIVDRLESRGLVERRPARNDRRVKVLAVTERGLHLRRRLLVRMAEPPEPIARLSPQDQRTLCEILGRMSRSTPAGRGGI